MVGLEKALEKLYTEEVDIVEGFERIDALQEGEQKLRFTSRVIGEGQFPSGDDKGQGTMTPLPGGTVVARCDGTVTTDKGKFDWQSREISKVVDEDGKVIKGLDILTISTKSQDLLWMNELIVLLEHKHYPSRKKIIQTGYKLK